MQEISTAEKAQATKEQSTEEASSLRYPTARAALTSGMGEMATKVLTIVLSIATARMLEPREVGLLGLSVIVIGVISMIGVYPETAAVAVRGEASDGEYALAASTIRAAVTLLLLVALVLTFPLVGGYLTGADGGLSQLQELIKILIWVPVFEWVSGYSQIFLQRRLDLNYLAWVQLVQPVIFVGLAIILLLEGRGYVGVAWANLVSSAATTALVWGRLWQRGWLNWEGWPDRKVWRETALGSARMFVGGFGGFLGGRVDNLMVAGAIGPAAMSFYSMAWNASRTPAHVFAKAISFVLVPTIARIQDDPERVQRGLRECLRHSYLLLAPVCALFFVSAPLLVTFVLGPKWLPVVPALRVMCFTVLVAPILFASTALLVGTGRAHMTGIATLAHLIALIM
ncbi:MAG TPA: oligosaccharide flippase family protein, partial [Blastocatellia bacterium]|nr:oligosaccharide flippase family protein [Blastocatellia bacterium]